MSTTKIIALSLAAAFALSMGLEFYDDMFNMELDDVLEDTLKYGFFITVPALMWHFGKKLQNKS
ncbi:MAG: hypothetical protein ATN35_01845 [Epulopiscium sp. Nele67-Bin004]|nr:MAG: hypothetical protein ATN35_01845 [Epulopiscium sp. Nele67-Bin004]